LHQQFPKGFLCKTHREPGVTWSDVWKNMLVKQKPKVLVVVVVREVCLDAVMGILSQSPAGFPWVWRWTETAGMRLMRG